MTSLHPQGTMLLSSIPRCDSTKSSNKFKALPPLILSFAQAVTARFLRTLQNPAIFLSLGFQWQLLIAEEDSYHLRSISKGVRRILSNWRKLSSSAFYSILQHRNKAIAFYNGSYPSCCKVLQISVECNQLNCSFDRLKVFKRVAKEYTYLSLCFMQTILFKCCKFKKSIPSRINAK